MTETRASEVPVELRRRAAFAAWDLAVVVSFVLIGRDTHEESVGLVEVARTGAPFALALLGAWLTPLVHRMPWRIGAGVAVGVITTGVGLFFRGVVFNEGLSGAFPFVAAAYLVGLMALARVLYRLWVVGRTA